MTGYLASFLSKTNPCFKFFGSTGHFLKRTTGNQKEYFYKGMNKTMEFVIDVYLIFLILFFSIKKKFHIIVNIFNYFVLAFLLSSYFSIISVNFGAFKIDGDIKLEFLFRLYELIFEPLICIFYLNFFSSINSKIKKIVLSVFVFFIFWVAEFLFVQLGVVTFINWNYQKTLISLFGILLATYFCQQWFRSILKKEGIRT